MEFKQSVFTGLTLILVVGLMQVFSYTTRFNDQDHEDCFEEANITDPKIQELALSNTESSYPGKHCFIK